MVDTVDRETLLRNLSVIDRLDAGWQPGDLELETARLVQDWLIVPSKNGVPYRLRGIAWSLPINCTLIDVGIVALDQSARWARLWDEWVVIDDPIESATIIDVDGLRCASADWLLGEIQRLPAPS